MKNFKSEINQLKSHIKANPSAATLKIGGGDSSWTMIYCKKSGAYYAMKGSSATIISFGTSSCIKQAYRIDPETGEAWTIQRHAKLKVGAPIAPIFVGTDTEPRLFAVKEFNKSAAREKLATNELNALKKHQFAETDLVFHDKNPLIISDYFPGKMLIDETGASQIDKKLSFSDRIQLILQLAVQLQAIHSDRRAGDAMLHTDIKSQNVMVHTPSSGTPNAFVIDFGSARDIGSNGKTSITHLGGLSPYAIPPEAISEVKTKPVLDQTQQDKNIGYLDRASDIYAMGPVFANILGAKTPYSHRLGDIQDGDVIDLNALRTQIKNGFNFNGLMGDLGALDLEIEDERPCGYVVRNQSFPPQDLTTLLEDYDIPDSCYIAYKNQTVYVDKFTNTVKKYQKKSSPNQEETNALDHSALQQLETIHKHNKNSSASSLLQPLIMLFIENMVSLEPAERPTTEETLDFFYITNKLCDLVENKASYETAELERLFKLGIMQLQLILIREWGTLLPVSGLPGEPAQTIALGKVDFASLQDSEIQQIDSQIKEPGEDDDRNFQFLSPRSDLAKVHAFLINKYEDKLTETEKDKLTQILITIQKLKTLNSDVAYERALGDLRSLSQPMLQCLLSDTAPAATFLEDMERAHEFANYSSVIETIAPEYHQILKNQQTTNYCEPLSENHPDITKLAQGNALDFKTTESLVDFLNTLRQEEPNIIAAYSVKTHEKMVDDVTKVLFKELKQYLTSIKDLKGDTYQKLSLFGLFGYPVGEKRAATHALMDAIATGNYTDLLENTAALGALKQGKLGVISSELLHAIEQKSPTAGNK